ncbi:ribonuclease HII [Caldibacillus thermoamylovorans]|uniref:ribonuclease HII n=1 Tax=Caldibacillus thermoamylovorans TaxID=35841 RepID=UPI001D085930|nr:ribonuclease HII [Caldibacillus thermoamylovorans]MCB5934014.1 ribonuclease HII [Bacillus sp. DFI.2.34]MCB7075286.1 ribonuclease HII [Caldibacillus thermoamylovorans]
MKQTIKEIEMILQSVTEPDDPFIKKCQQDERKGVQALLQRWKKKQEELMAEKRRFEKMMVYEKEAQKQGFQYVAGIDEVGRGPLAGPVVAAAVILPENIFISGINDSKKLSSKKREQLYQEIKNEALAIGIGVVGADVIDEINIYQATKKAMNIAINQLSIFPNFLLIDAMKIDTPITQRSLIKGDSLSVSIASASIIAKVYRDRLMMEYSKKYPEYQFEKNAGYGTREHIQAIRKFGPTPIHRKTFAPIKEYIHNENEK